MKQLFAMGFLVATLSLTAGAQNTFSSGSTGADGAFSPTTSQTITVPASGVFNYTTVNIPAGVIITYVQNPTTNVPLTILASGAVQINGSIHVDGLNGTSSGFGGLGGPGGARGGNGGANGNAGVPGDGPGGAKGGTFNPSGSPVCVAGGAGGFQLTGAGGSLGGGTYGTPSLVPLIGGSGGGGGCANAGNNVGGGGGGGGGAILIASSSSITFGPPAGSSTITATGGSCSCSTSASLFSSGGGGSGGAIRLVANSISGFVMLNVNGGSGGGNAGGAGYIRVETFNTTGFSPNNQGAPVSSALPSTAVPTNIPSLQIVSIAGVAVPANPIGSFQGSPDVVLPTTQTNPVSVVINAANIPVGTTVNLTATPASGTGASATTTLAGSLSSSSGTASISLPGGLTVLTATSIIDLATLGDLRPLFINGEKVEKIEVASRIGGGSELAYITQSGRRIRVR